MMMMKNENYKIENFFWQEYGTDKKIQLSKAFLANAKNLYLVEKAILYPTDCNMKLVDETFQLHYINVQKNKICQ
ncbi:hypothetical protein OL548_32180 [Lysinibacillus sp. MHQ-1]|nr:hypothetical protein OL548_32180 [Lysinibacillus sp. MHQ-1]